MICNCFFVQVVRSSREGEKKMLKVSKSQTQKGKRETYLETGTDPGKRTSFFMTFANVAFLFGPLNGVVAN